MTSYSGSFQSEEAARTYETLVYAEDSYDSFIWSLQRPRLLAVARALRDRLGRPPSHLDFACGTGRVLAAVEEISERSTGLDVSREMLAVARQRCPRAELVVGDLRENPCLVAPRFDLITAFRFFLNAEPALRGEVMVALGARLRDDDSRLIFNIHGNRWSLRHLGILRRRLRGERHSEMALREVRALVEGAGLDIESWTGFGVLPRSAYGWVLAPLARRWDRQLAGRGWLRAVSSDLMFVCKPRK